MVKFELKDPASLCIQSLNFLEEACKKSQLSILTVANCLQVAREGKAFIYEIYDEQLIGCMTLSIRESGTHRYLELPLLGGRNIVLWRDDLVKFLFEQAKKHNCNKFTMIGRKGFERLFPEMRLLCCVYGRDL